MVIEMTDQNLLLTLLSMNVYFRGDGKEADSPGGFYLSFQLGHRHLGVRGEARTTRHHGNSHEFLAEAATALAAWVNRVIGLAKAYSHANSHRSALARTKSG